MDEGGGCGNECLYPVRFTSGSNLGTFRFGLALNESFRRRLCDPPFLIKSSAPIFWDVNRWHTETLKNEMAVPTTVASGYRISQAPIHNFNPLPGCIFVLAGALPCVAVAKHFDHDKSKSKSKLAGPKAALLTEQDNEMQGFTESSVV